MADHILADLGGPIRTFPELSDLQAAHNPDRPWTVFVSPSNPEEIASLTFKQLADGSHTVAHILRPGRKGPEDEVIALLLHTDVVLYVPVFLGCLRAGLVPYLMSPRNSVEAICSMLEASNCRRIVVQPLTAPLAAAAQTKMASKGVSLALVDLPSIHTVFPGSFGSDTDQPLVATPYPPRPTPGDPDRPTKYIHSSGSTGLPKTVPLSDRLQWRWAMQSVIYGSATRKVRLGSMMLPTFHLLGFSAQLTYPLLSSEPAVVDTPRYPELPQLAPPEQMWRAYRLAKCTAMFAVPSIVEAWSHNAECVEYLKTLSLLFYGGGPLSASVGNQLVNAGIPLYCGYGGSEFGQPGKSWDETPGSLAPLEPAKDWDYIQISRFATVRWEPQGDGTFELVLLANDQYPLAMYNVPGQKAYATSDVFRPHPTREGLWKIVGRKDDVITLSTGEKIVPIPQESHIGASPLVVGCIMFGREQEQAGILIEPRQAVAPDDEQALIDFRNQIWPIVEEANATAPAFARLFKEMIIVTDPAKPLPRAGKGTVMRRPGISLYEAEIAKLYETIRKSGDSQGIPPPRTWTAEDILPWLVEHARSINSGQLPAPAVSLFQQGFDSLSATFLRNRVIGTLRSSSDPKAASVALAISPNLVYETPVIEALASRLASLVDDSSLPGKPQGDIAAEVDALVAKYTANIAQRAVSAEAAISERTVVLLTGATGNIGSHILAALLSDDRVSKVYALIRPSSGVADRLRASFEERSLSVELLQQPKLTRLMGDVTHESLGLERSVFDEVTASVTHIVHNAWTVNFNLPLSSYQKDIAAVRSLVDVCASPTRNVKLVFTSSIAVAGRWDPREGPVPERVLSRAELASTTGYAASKYAAEKILEVAARNAVAVTIVRVGQACGSRETGAWGTSEWFPIMVKSGLALGCFPDLATSVDWVAVDTIGSAYLDVVIARDKLPLVVNLVSPSRSPWRVILQGVLDELGQQLPLVPLSEWVAKLDSLANAATAADLDRIPAIKLQAFFHDLTAQPAEVTFDTSALVSVSPTMKTSRALSSKDAHLWVRYWKAKGFVS